MSSQKPRSKGPRLITLGEATHGTREFMQLRREIVKEYGICTILLEAGYIPCKKLTELIQDPNITNKANFESRAKKIISPKRHYRGDDMIKMYWTYCTQEFIDMLWDLCKLNRGKEQKTSIIGIDVQNKLRIETELSIYQKLQTGGIWGDQLPYKRRCELALTYFKKMLKSYNPPSPMEKNKDPFNFDALYHKAVHEFTIKWLSRMCTLKGIETMFMDWELDTYDIREEEMARFTTAVVSRVHKPLLYGHLDHVVPHSNEPDSLANRLIRAGIQLSPIAMVWGKGQFLGNPDYVFTKLKSSTITIAEQKLYDIKSTNNKEQTT